MIRSGQRNLPGHSFNQYFQHIDDLIVFNNAKFWEYVKDIYSSQRDVEKTKQSNKLASYLDLTFTIEKMGKLSKVCDKRDVFDFHIVNFQFLSNNIPTGPSCGVYMLQFITCAKCWSYYDDFRACISFILIRTSEKFIQNFFGRYQDLIVKYQRSVSDIVRKALLSDN